MGFGILIINDKAEIGLTKVEEEIQGCGIGTILTILRFIDENIQTGGYNIDKSSQWEHNQALRQKAKDECNTIMYLQNAAKVPAASKSYLNAAVETGYKKLFSFKDGNGKDGDGYENDLKSALAKFTSNTQAKMFLNENGAFWYFCK